MVRGAAAYGPGDPAMSPARRHMASPNTHDRPSIPFREVHRDDPQRHLYATQRHGLRCARHLCRPIRTGDRTAAAATRPIVPDRGRRPGDRACLAVTMGPSPCSPRPGTPACRACHYPRPGQSPSINELLGFVGNNNKWGRVREPAQRDRARVGPPYFGVGDRVELCLENLVRRGLAPHILHFP